MRPLSFAEDVVALNQFKDHFSGHASDYARYRPQYPPELFRHLATLCRGNVRAWDCATGNGQAAVQLAEHFDEVIATDASAEQVAAAIPHPSVRYRRATAEHCGLPSSSVDLITVAQGLHWFDISAFMLEATRVLRSGGVLAVWCYENFSTSDAINHVTGKIFAEIDAFWPPEREIVNNHYDRRDVKLPWPDLKLPPFRMTQFWDADAVLGYMRTWSATRRYMAVAGIDPVGLHENALRDAWGEGEREVSWPLTVRAARRD